MTELLVSVRDTAEADLALSCGVSIIDVKEPRRGSLGRADWETINAIGIGIRQSDCAGSQNAMLSVALGEVIEVDSSWHSAVRELSANVSFAKIGLADAGKEWRQHWADAMASLARSIKPVGVAYADWSTAGSPRPEEIIEHAHQTGCKVVLVDTFAKTSGRLFDIVSPSQIGLLVEQVQGMGMRCAIAGSLDENSILKLSEFAQPDIIAVRGAACRDGNRAAGLDRARIDRLIALLAASASR